MEEVYSPLAKLNSAKRQRDYNLAVIDNTLLERERHLKAANEISEELDALNDKRHKLIEELRYHNDAVENADDDLLDFRVDVMALEILIQNLTVELA